MFWSSQKYWQDCWVSRAVHVDRLACVDNQVQHLSQARKAIGHDLRIYDLALGGSTIPYVEQQAAQLTTLLKKDDLKLDVASAVLGIIHQACRSSRTLTSYSRLGRHQ